MEIQDIIIYSFMTMFSLGLLIISIKSYIKYKSIKLVFIIFVFVLFLIKSIIISLGMYEEGLLSFIYSSYFTLFDLAILIVLFMASLKR